MSKLAARVLELLPDAYLARADGDKWLTTYGPPGTGKTTSMLRLVERHLETGAAGPETLMIATFTRNARAEAFGRLKAATGIGPEEFPWVRTIHSACYRLLELAPERVMGPKDYDRFGEAQGYDFTTTRPRDIDDPFGAASLRTLGDFLLAAEDLRRNMRISVAEAASRFSAPAHLGVGYGPELAADFAAQLAGYKHEVGLVDFTDMLEAVVGSGLRPPVTHLFVDEAQDLTPLQWAVINGWAEAARRVFVFGDDDQAIFEWSGADPRALMQLPGSQLVLSKSHRLPSAVHREACELIAQVSDRVDKKFEPMAQGGKVGRVWSWYEAFNEAQARDGRALLLARNRAHLEEAREVLSLNGVPFVDRAGGGGVPDPTSNRGRAIRTALDLAAGKVILSRFDLINLQGAMRSGLWPGLPAKAPMYALADLPRPVAAELKRDPLDAVRMPDRERTYIRNILAHAGRSALDTRPNLELSTIHGVKGEEAETVVVCTGMTRQTYADYIVNPDAEHRVFYVAATRSKHSLFWLRAGGAGYDW